VKEYDILLPLYYGDNSPIEARKFQNLQNRLLEHFEGVTYFPQANEGFFKMGNVAYRDELVVYRVVAAKTAPARRFLVQLKKDLKASLGLDDVFIVEREAEIL
jgi:hypothetical protein